MSENYKKYLYIFDLLGRPAQLRIFDNDNYKSTFSSLLSIILIFFSISFGIYSIIDFLRFKNPNVVYSKNNDNYTNRSIKIKDTLLILGLIENKQFTIVDKTEAYYDAELKINYKNGSFYNIPLTIENCEFGKNLDIKYKDKLPVEDESINKYYCFSEKDGDLPLFYDPEIGESNIYIYAKTTDKSIYIADELLMFICNGNDIIEHDSKDNPISNNYFTPTYTSFSSYKFSLINFYFQFIKYESDNGLFFPSTHSFNAKAFSHMSTVFTNYIEQLSNFHIGTIMIQISKVNFDFYKRTYPRVQSLIAEVMSVISLVFGIFHFIADFLLNKKMSKDISKILLNKININILKDKEININNNRNNIADLENEKKIEEIKTKDNINNNINIPTDLSLSNNIKKDTNLKIMENLGYCDIIGSFICSSKKAKLINLCHELINRDLCIEQILSRLYELEIIVNILLKKNKVNIDFTQNEKLEEINYYINLIENNLSEGT